MMIDDNEYKKAMLETAKKHGRVRGGGSNIQGQSFDLLKIHGKMYKFKPSSIKILSEQKESIIADYKSGVEVAKIATKFNLHFDTLRRFLKLELNAKNSLSKLSELKPLILKARKDLEDGISINEIQKKYDLPKKDAKILVRNFEVRKLYKSGVLNKNIAKEMNLSHSTIYFIVHDKFSSGH